MNVLCLQPGSMKGELCPVQAPAKAAPHVHGMDLTPPFTDCVRLEQLVKSVGSNYITYLPISSNMV